MTKLQTEEPLPLGFVFQTLEGIGTCLTTVSAHNNRPIARLAADEETAAQVATLLAAKPARTILYEASEAPPGIFALLYAVVSRQEIEAWRPEDETAAVFLGTVVRYKHDMDPNLSFDENCTKHFAAILSGKGVEPVDKALEAMMHIREGEE